MNRQIPFRIVGLYVESFNLTDICLKEDIPVEVRTNYEFGVIPEDHMVMARLTYAYLQEEAELLQITLVSTFDVKPKEFQTMLQGNTFFRIQPHLFIQHGLQFVFREFIPAPLLVSQGHGG